MTYDWAIIGSGFGGSISAYHLSARGRSVCILERGAEWPRGSFPRGSRRMQDLFWDEAAGTHGILDYRSFEKLDVLVGAGAGGGSLVYSGFMVEPPDSAFADWPFGITRADLLPHYAAVRAFMDVKAYPVDRLPYSDTSRIQVFKKAVQSLGRGQFRVTDLATQFMSGPEEWGTTFRNQHGAIQTGCVMCGECNVGCRYHAKSTLDLNYLFAARAQGAELRARHSVDCLERIGEGWRVRGTDGEGTPFSVDARRVIVAAGALGSTELLLRCRDQHGTLPSLPAAIGQGLSGNGDSISLLTGLREDPLPVEPSRGPVLVLAIEHDGFLLEDTGMADFVAWYVDGMVPELNRSKLAAALHLGLDQLQALFGVKPHFGLIKDLASVLQSEKFTSRAIYFISVGKDAASGVVRLDEEHTLQVDWTEDERYMARVQAELGALADHLGGQLLVGKSFSFHLLGGCALGTVVDGNAEVLGHAGLHVLDGAIVPGAIGVNPSLTIAALTDRIAQRLATL